MNLNVELINTGTELMLGYVTNTNQQWLCRKLSDLDFQVTRQIAVPDVGPAIQREVSEALTRSDVVITTGGLGPTADDLTRECIATLFGRELREDPAIVAHIASYFESRRRVMPGRTRVQALVPEGAIVLPNGNGTAPGLIIEDSRSVPGGPSRPRCLIMLPGPPRELHPMFTTHVVPFLQQRFPSEDRFTCRVVRTTGIGESALEEKVVHPLAHLVAAGLELGYCARFGEVDVRLAARGQQGAQMVDEAERVVRSLLGKDVFGQDSDLLESIVVRALTDRGETLAVAESCTGGYLAHRLTNVPGASAVFLGGFVTYGNAAKQTVLGVRGDILARHGAVSEAVAREMAEGARARLGATHALAVTGIAGPSGGTPDKPVGTVFLARAGPATTIVLHQVNRYDRESFKSVTSQQALDLLRRVLVE